MSSIISASCRSGDVAVMAQPPSRVHSGGGPPSMDTEHTHNMARNYSTPSLSQQHHHNMSSQMGMCDGGNGSGQQMHPYEHGSSQYQQVVHPNATPSMYQQQRQSMLGNAGGGQYVTPPMSEQRQMLMGMGNNPQHASTNNLMDDYTYSDAQYTKQQQHQQMMHRRLSMPQQQPMMPNPGGGMSRYGSHGEEEMVARRRMSQGGVMPPRRNSNANHTLLMNGGCGGVGGGSSSVMMGNSSERSDTLNGNGNNLSPYSPENGPVVEEPEDCITQLRVNDVLMGRGGGTNNYIGNIRFRKLVQKHKVRYLACSKVDKPKVAREVVHLWRTQQHPPGRFLARKDEDTGSNAKGNNKSEDNKSKTTSSSENKKDNSAEAENSTSENKNSSHSSSNLTSCDAQVIWYEVGEKKANSKASQCLRERTQEVMPFLQQLREEQDRSTEEGVLRIRQQQQMERQQRAGQLGGSVEESDLLQQRQQQMEKQELMYRQQQAEQQELLQRQQHLERQQFLQRQMHSQEMDVSLQRQNQLMQQQQLGGNHMHQGPLQPQQDILLGRNMHPQQVSNNNGHPMNNMGYCDGQSSSMSNQYSYDSNGNYGPLDSSPPTSMHNPMVGGMQNSSIQSHIHPQYDNGNNNQMQQMNYDPMSSHPMGQGNMGGNPRLNHEANHMTGSFRPYSSSQSMPADFEQHDPTLQGMDNSLSHRRCVSQQYQQHMPHPESQLQRGSSMMLSSSSSMNQLNDPHHSGNVMGPVPMAHRDIGSSERSGGSGRARGSVQQSFLPPNHVSSISTTLSSLQNGQEENMMAPQGNVRGATSVKRFEDAAGLEDISAELDGNTPDDDMTELEYEQKVVAMQKQLHLQRLQLQKLQMQRMQRQKNRRTTDASGEQPKGVSSSSSTPPDETTPAPPSRRRPSITPSSSVKKLPKMAVYGDQGQSTDTKTALLDQDGTHENPETTDMSPTISATSKKSCTEQMKVVSPVLNTESKPQHVNNSGPGPTGGTSSSRTPPVNSDDMRDEGAENTADVSDRGVREGQARPLPPALRRCWGGDRGSRFLSRHPGIMAPKSNRNGPNEKKKESHTNDKTCLNQSNHSRGKDEKDSCPTTLPPKTEENDQSRVCTVEPEENEVKRTISKFREARRQSIKKDRTPKKPPKRSRSGTIRGMAAPERKNSGIMSIGSIQESTTENSSSHHTATDEKPHRRKSTGREPTLEDYQQKLEQFIATQALPADDNSLDGEDMEGGDSEEVDAFEASDDFNTLMQSASSFSAGNIDLNPEDHNVDSDLEDDWEKQQDRMAAMSHMHFQHHHNFRKTAPRRSTSTKSKGAVDRRKSGTDASLMSLDGSSIFSNLTEDLHAAAAEMDKKNTSLHSSSDADEKKKAQRPSFNSALQKMKRHSPRRSVSNHSHLSIMSDMTDLSNDLDDLSIHDEL